VLQSTWRAEALLYILTATAPGFDGRPHALEDAEDAATGEAEATRNVLYRQPRRATQADDLVVAGAEALSTDAAGEVVAAEGQRAVQARRRQLAALVAVVDLLREGVAAAGIDRWPSASTGTAAGRFSS
jgi:hypothetical protein